MAGQVDSPTAIAAKRPQPPPAQSRFLGHNLVDASVSLGGRSFATLIREGASAEELIEKVAKENGGGVARVFYPEFNTWEIVAVKIGDELLVKGDPKRVAEADFSAFADQQGIRSAAIRASRDSEGGIHFSLGESGIPIAVTQDLGVVFPNAEELRVGRSTRNIALWMTSVSADPMSLRDLDRSYGRNGGISVSADALRKIAQAHGGGRSEKLVLEDNLLVLNKDTGEISTASQFSSSLMKDVVPEQASEFRLPASASEDRPAQGAGGPCIRMDGSPARVPLLSTRAFETSIMELLTVRFNPLGGLQKEAAGIKDAPPPSSRPQHPIAVAQLGFEPRPPDAAQTKEDEGASPPAPSREKESASQAPKAVPAAASGHVPRSFSAGPITPEAIQSAWLRPRTGKLELEAPASVSALMFGGPQENAPEKPGQRKTRQLLPGRAEEGRKPERSVKAVTEKARKIRAENKARRNTIPKPQVRAPRKETARAVGARKPPRARKSIPLVAATPGQARTRPKSAPAVRILREKSQEALSPLRKQAKKEKNASRSSQVNQLQQKRRKEPKPAGPSLAIPLTKRPPAKRRQARKAPGIHLDLLGLFRRKRRKKVSGRTAAGN